METETDRKSTEPETDGCMDTETDADENKIAEIENVDISQETETDRMQTESDETVVNCTSMRNGPEIDSRLTTETDRHATSETEPDRLEGTLHRDRPQDMRKKQKLKLKAKIEFWKSKETAASAGRKQMTVNQKLMEMRKCPITETETKRKSSKKTPVRKHSKKKEETEEEGQTKLTDWTETEAVRRQPRVKTRTETERPEESLTPVRKKLIDIRRKFQETERKPHYRPHSETGTPDHIKYQKQAQGNPQKRKEMCRDRDRTSETAGKRRKQESVKEILARMEGKKRETESAKSSDKNLVFNFKTQSCFSELGQGVQVELGEGGPGHLGEGLVNTFYGVQQEMLDTHARILPQSGVGMSPNSKKSVIVKSVRQEKLVKPASRADRIGDNYSGEMKI